MLNKAVIADIDKNYHIDFYLLLLCLLHYTESMQDLELTKEMLVRSRVIARGRAIRDVERLVFAYGGKTSLWLKKSSPPIEIAGDIYEYHWYEQHGIGRFEVKRKKVKES